MKIVLQNHIRSLPANIREGLVVPRRGRELMQFCLNDSNGQVMVTHRALSSRGQFILLYKQIYYSNSCSTLYLAVREEKMGNRRQKVVYGWEQKDDLLDYDSYNIKISIAEKKNGGNWHLKPDFEILSKARDVSGRNDPHNRSFTNDYVDFCFRDVGSEVREIGWPVYEQKGPLRRIARKGIKNHNCPIELPENFESNELISVTSQHGRFKVVRFWRSRSEMEAGQLPFEVRFITFKQKNGKWRLFWKRTNSPHPLRELILQGELRSEEADLNLLVIADFYPDVFEPLLARQMISSNRDLIQLLSSGLANRAYGKWWDIKPRRTGLGYVTYSTRAIFGFDQKLGRVFSVIQEKGNEIVARFYKNPDNAARNIGLLKVAVLSRKQIDEIGQEQWVPLDQPEITFSLIKQQRQKIEIARIKKFLLKDAPLGEELDLAPRRVLEDGQVRFKIDGKFICIPGFQAQAGAKVWGRIVIEDRVKRVYFWPDRERKGVPLNPEGRILAREKQNGGDWEIVRSAASDDWRMLKGMAKSYGEILCETIYAETFPWEWKVYKAPAGQRIRGMAKKTIHGTVLQLEVPGNFSPDYIFSATTEYNERFKVEAFWLSETGRERKAEPFALRTVAFRPTSIENGDGKWGVHFGMVDDLEAFGRLVEEGKITLQDMQSVLIGISRDYPNTYPALKGKIMTEWTEEDWAMVWRNWARIKAMAALAEAERMVKRFMALEIKVQEELKIRSQGVPASPYGLLAELNKFNAMVKGTHARYRDHWSILSQLGKRAKDLYIALSAIAHQPFLRVRVPYRIAELRKTAPVLAEVTSAR